MDQALGRDADSDALGREPELTERLHAELEGVEQEGPEVPVTEIVEGVFLFDDDDDDGDEPEPAPEDDAAATAPTPRPAQERAATPSKPAPEARRSTMRVPSASLDRLMDLIGALVTAGSRTRLVAQQDNPQELLEAIDAQERLLEGVREAALSLRMVEIGETFRTFRRMVREVSTKLGKQVHLELTGTDTEIDKSVVESIRDPLMHLVRNGLDHGIERPEERVARGKPPQATLELRAFQEFGTVVIEVRDDGAGLDCERILEKAKARGLAPSDMQPDHPSVPEFIMHAGFSTKSEVSDLSGRGVGLDVVNTAVRALRGTLGIETERGVGTCFRIRLPLTLAIISGFLIRVGEGAFIVPMDKVVECVAVPPECREGASLTDLVERRGEVVPYIRMHRLLELPEKPHEGGDLVLVRHGSGVVGLLVDQLIGAHQTVVKPIGPVFKHQSTFSGASLLGSGEVALILDTDAIVRRSLPASVGAA